jgi:tRNA-specific 2-thiouridylase
MLGQAELATTVLPVGDHEKAAVRRLAETLGLRTAGKPDSQDVCFITSRGGRREFLGRRLRLHPARIVDTGGVRLGTAPALELVTVGQRTGLGLPGGGPKRYVLEVDRATATVTVGSEDELVRDAVRVDAMTWVDSVVTGPVLVQCSAHGAVQPGELRVVDGGVVVDWERPQRRVAPGQSVVFYDRSDRYVLGGGICAAA